MFTPILAGRWNSKRSFHVGAFIMWLIRVVSHDWVSAGSLSRRTLTVPSWSQHWWPKERLSLLTCRVHSAILRGEQGGATSRRVQITGVPTKRCTVPDMSFSFHPLLSCQRDTQPSANITSSLLQVSSCFFFINEHLWCEDERLRAAVRPRLTNHQSYLCQWKHDKW